VPDLLISIITGRRGEGNVALIGRAVNDRHD
jgi:hypothetical protein